MQQRMARVAAGVVSVCLLLGLPGAAQPRPAQGAAPAPQPAGGVTGSAQFCNATRLSIPSGGAASPYPSSIPVAGLPGTITAVSVTLNRLRHDFYDDLDILLAGPQGQSVLLLSDAGGQCHRLMSPTFQDNYPAMENESCPAAGEHFRPTNYPPDPDSFPAPAPPPPYGSALQVFNGSDPNGAWSLYVVDDYSIFLGEIGGGWCVTLTTAAPAASRAAGSKPR